MSFRYKPRVLNLRDYDGKCPLGAVRIDRRTKWGNPFLVGRDGTRNEVIAMFRKLLPFMPVDIAELRGKDLACWCAPLPCHGDVLLAEANR